MISCFLIVLWTLPVGCHFESTKARHAENEIAAGLPTVSNLDTAWFTEGDVPTIPPFHDRQYIRVESAPGTLQQFQVGELSLRLRHTVNGHTKLKFHEAVIPVASCWMGETEVTYVLWETIHSWATAEDRLESRYHFRSPGQMGMGIMSDESHSTEIPPNLLNERHPVTHIDWFSAVVWTNALTEWVNAHSGSELSPVYRRRDGSVIRDARLANAGRSRTNDVPTDIFIPVEADLYQYVDEKLHYLHDGFRLPTPSEYDVAGCWLDPNRIPTPKYEWNQRMEGQYYAFHLAASGAMYIPEDDPELNGEFAWYIENSNTSGIAWQTHEVGTKRPNHLGIFDLSGNNNEWLMHEEETNWENRRRAMNYDSFRMYCTSSFFGGSPSISSFKRTPYLTGARGLRIARTPLVPINEPVNPENQDSDRSATVAENQSDEETP